jgi:hypothetical protein
MPQFPVITALLTVQFDVVSTLLMISVSVTPVEKYRTPRKVYGKRSTHFHSVQATGIFRGKEAACKKC